MEYLDGCEPWPEAGEEPERRAAPEEWGTPPPGRPMLLGGLLASLAACLGILGLALFSLQGAPGGLGHGELAARQQGTRDVVAALEAYRATHGTYPETLRDLPQAATGGAQARGPRALHYQRRGPGYQLGIPTRMGFLVCLSEGPGRTRWRYGRGASPPP